MLHFATMLLVPSSTLGQGFHIHFDELWIIQQHLSFLSSSTITSVRMQDNYVDDATTTVGAVGRACPVAFT
jgi:hypothetical protein